MKIIYFLEIVKLVTEMKTGRYAGCDHLPPEKELAEQLGISRTQLRDVLASLEREGFIYTIAAKGCFVARKNVELLREENLKAIETHIEQILQLAATCPNFEILEIVYSDVDWRKEVTNESLEYKDGYITIPDRPGLGIEIDPAAGFTVGPLSVNFYGAIIALGLILAVVYAWKRAHQFGIKPDDITDAVLDALLDTAVKYQTINAELIPPEEVPGTPAPEGSTEQTEPTEPTEPEEPQPVIVESFHVIFKVTEGNTSQGFVNTWQGMVISRKGGQYGMRFFDASGIDDHTLSKEEQEEVWQQMKNFPKEYGCSRNIFLCSYCETQMYVLQCQ